MGKAGTSGTDMSLIADGGSGFSGDSTSFEFRMENNNPARDDNSNRVYLDYSVYVEGERLDDQPDQVLVAGGGSSAFVTTERIDSIADSGDVVEMRLELVMVYDGDSWSRISDESDLDSMGMEREYRGRMPSISDPQLVSDTSAEFNDSATEFEVTIDNGNPTTFDDTHTFYLNYILNVDGVANDDYQTDMQVRGGNTETATLSWSSSLVSGADEVSVELADAYAYQNGSWDTTLDPRDLNVSLTHTTQPPAGIDLTEVHDVSSGFNDDLTEFELTVENRNPSVGDGSNAIAITYDLFVDGSEQGYDGSLQVTGGSSDTMTMSWPEDVVRGADIVTVSATSVFVDGSDWERLTNAEQFADLNVFIHYTASRDVIPDGWSDTATNRIEERFGGVELNGSLDEVGEGLYAEAVVTPLGVTSWGDIDLGYDDFAVEWRPSVDGVDDIEDTLEGLERMADIVFGFDADILLPRRLDDRITIGEEFVGSEFTVGQTIEFDPVTIPVLPDGFDEGLLDDISDDLDVDVPTTGELFDQLPNLPVDLATVDNTVTSGLPGSIPTPSVTLEIPPEVFVNEEVVSPRLCDPLDVLSFASEPFATVEEIDPTDPVDSITGTVPVDASGCEYIPAGVVDATLYIDGEEVATADTSWDTVTDVDTDVVEPELSITPDLPDEPPIGDVEIEFVLTDADGTEVERATLDFTPSCNPAQALLIGEPDLNLPDEPLNPRHFTGFDPELPLTNGCAVTDLIADVTVDYGYADGVGTTGQTSVTIPAGETVDVAEEVRTPSNPFDEDGDTFIYRMSVSHPSDPDSPDEIDGRVWETTFDDFILDLPDPAELVVTALPSDEPESLLPPTDTVELEATVENVGEELAEASVYFNGSLVDSGLELDGGESETVSEDISVSEIGSMDFDVEVIMSGTNETFTDSASYQLSRPSLDVSLNPFGIPDEIPTGEDFGVGVDITNPSDVAAEVDVDVFGETVETGLTIPAQGSHTVTDEIRFDERGGYDITTNVSYTGPGDSFTDVVSVDVEDITPGLPEVEFVTVPDSVEIPADVGQFTIDVVAENVGGDGFVEIITDGDSREFDPFPGGEERDISIGFSDAELPSPGRVTDLTVRAVDETGFTLDVVTVAAELVEDVEPPSLSVVSEVVPDFDPLEGNSYDVGVVIGNSGGESGPFTVEIGNRTREGSVSPGGETTVVESFEMGTETQSTSVSVVDETAGDTIQDSTFTVSPGEEDVAEALFEVISIITPDEPPVPTETFDVGLVVENVGNDTGSVVVEVGDTPTETTVSPGSSREVVESFEMGDSVETVGLSVSDGAGGTLFESEADVSPYVPSSSDFSISIISQEIRSSPGADVEPVVSITSDAPIPVDVGVVHDPGWRSSTATQTTVPPGETVEVGETFAVPTDLGGELYGGVVEVTASSNGADLGDVEYTINTLLDPDAIDVTIDPPGRDEVVSGGEYTLNVVIDNTADQEGDVLVVHEYTTTDGAETQSSQTEFLPAGGTVTVPFTQDGPYEVGESSYRHRVEAYDDAAGEEIFTDMYDLTVRTPDIVFDESLSPDGNVEAFGDARVGVSVRNEGDGPGRLYVEIDGDVLADGERIREGAARSYTTDVGVPSTSTSFPYLIRDDSVGKGVESGEIRVSVFDPPGDDPTDPERPDEELPGGPTDPRDDESDGPDEPDGEEPYDGILTYLDPLGLFGTSRQF